MGDRGTRGSMPSPKWRAVERVYGRPVRRPRTSSTDVSSRDDEGLPGRSEAVIRIALIPGRTVRRLTSENTASRRDPTPHAEQRVLTADTGRERPLAARCPVLEASAAVGSCGVSLCVDHDRGR